MPHITINNNEVIHVDDDVYVHMRHLEQSLAEHKAMVGDLQYACQKGLDAIYNELDDDIIESVNGVANAVHFMGEALTKAKQLQENT